MKIAILSVCGIVALMFLVPDVGGTCLDPYTLKTYPVDAVWYSNTHCRQFKCINLQKSWSIQIQACAVPKKKPGCVLRESDNNLKFPKCCPALVCRVSYEEADESN